MQTETKERILEAAERLFARGGFSATSLRDVASDAGVNLAGANYHFGSKEALLVAVWDRRFGPINEKRLVLLDELERLAGQDGPVLEDILTALFEPACHNWVPWNSEIPESLRQQLFGQFDEVWTRFEREAKVLASLNHPNIGGSLGDRKDQGVRSETSVK